MITGALREFKGRTCHAEYSRTPIGFRGHFFVRGPQVCGDSGGVPEWVVNAFDADDEIKTIAVNFASGGVVWHRPSND